MENKFKTDLEKTLRLFSGLIWIRTEPSGFFLVNIAIIFRFP